MATATKKNVKYLQQFGGVPYGNLSALHFNFTTNASGIWEDSDLATAVVDATKLRLGVLPAGMTLVNYMAIISDAFDTDVDFEIGFEYVDGVDSTAVPQDHDYFTLALDADATSVTFKTNPTAPVTLPKDAYLIITIETDDNEAAGVLDLFVIGIMEGK